MPFDQNDLPEWNAEGTAPPQEHKDSGWGMSEHPPADWFNWLFNKAYTALESLFANAQHKEEKGQANGYAALDEDGKVPAEQLNVTAPDDASLTTKGITKLNSSTTSTDETTATTPKLVNSKYTKPSTGIPKTDLETAVQNSLGKADSSYQKPATGIPKEDLETAVQTSLGKADTALQGVPNASSSTIGVVKIGQGVNVQSDGTISVSVFNHLSYWIQ
jgi:hypothetical protein